MEKLFLYNTLSRKKEEFLPIKKDAIGLYTCGPTVYNYAHIGNLRSYVFADILARTLKYNYGQEKVKWAMNLTDVDDKTIRDSKIKYSDLGPMEALKRLTSDFGKYFMDDLAKLNIKMPDKIMPATDPKYISKMQDLVKKIVDKGYGYIKDGSVYFNVKKYSEKYKYGKLINLDVSALKIGASVDTDEYDKENVQDFVLWKGKKEGEPFWGFELDGESLPGRPGWHIECSAMGEAELGAPFDIHTGGIDLKFPHHENEIAQSVIGYDVDEPVKVWMHNEFLMVNGVKMSKRFNNFYTLRDIEEKGINPLAFRFLCLQTGYGKVMNFTWEGLKAANEGMQHIFSQVRETGSEHGTSKINDKYLGMFLEAINDDLNTSKALAVVQELLKSDLRKYDIWKTILEFDKILGLDFDKIKRVAKFEGNVEVEDLIAHRNKARIEKNFLESDRLRNEIEKFGYTVEDTKDGQRVFKK
jgi:cysteinyl-tRNA synthetase